MPLKRASILAVALSCAAALACAQVDRAKRGCGDPPGYSDTPVIPGQTWKVHDIARPKPPRVASKPVTTPPPSDAIVLFDGKDLSKWTSYRRGEQMEPQWKVENGILTVAGRGDLVTKEPLGDIQLHLEWKAEPEGCGQWRGNSGVILMGRYEIQVLDTYENVTYSDGQAASIYGQFPPRVNASSPSGDWNSYDIVFEAPKFDGDKVVEPPRVTVIHNGVMVHNRQAFVGQMAHRVYKPFEPHGPEAPLVLQNHDATVYFRNIWARKLKGYDQK